MKTQLDIHAEAVTRGVRLPSAPIADGRWHRVPTDDRPTSRNGAYRITSDGAVLIQNHRHMDRPDFIRPGRVSDVDAATAQAIERARRDESRRAHAMAAQRAVALWRKAPCANAEHPYLARKGLLAAHGARLIGDRLVIAFGINREISTLQFIGPDGAKRFFRGGRKRGAYAVVGTTPTDCIVIAEGFATGASIHEATGLPIAVAGDAGNLLPVAQHLRDAFAGVSLVIAADNDPIGRARAEAAARAVGARWVMPPVSGSDFNDLASSYGADAVRAALASPNEDRTS